MVVNDEIIDRLVAAEIANLESRLKYRGVHVRRYGRATAFVSEDLPVRFFNSVLGVGPEILRDLDAIRAFYQQYGRKCALEIAPGRLTEPMAIELATHGFAMVEYHVGLARALTPNDATYREMPGVQIELVDRNDAQAFEHFLDVYLEGWGTTPGDEHAPAKQNMSAWRDNAEWTFYLARCAGLSAGTAILDVRGRTAMLGSASTLNSMRGRSVQRALIEKRTADAARVGCDLLIGGANFGTSSMRNQQRAGLSIVCTKGIWIDRT